MSKKKLVSLCLVVALVLTAAIGGTMAYFTDVSDDVENTFAIGDIDIELTETAGVKDGNTVVQDIKEGVNGYSYSNLMPSYEIVKTPVVTNESDNNDAYVRVFITMNNYVAINEAIDAVYEKGTTEDEKVASTQPKYDEIFDNWGIQHRKIFDGKTYLRGWMKKTEEQVLFVDYVRSPAKEYQFDLRNTFQTNDEKATPSAQLSSTQTGYYKKALDNDSRTYILYLKLDPGESYTLFNGLNVPAEFNAAQMEMFKGLKINVYADAIQTAGFDTPEDAFNALEDAHPLGWWN